MVDFTRMKHEGKDAGFPLLRTLYVRKHINFYARKYNGSNI